MFQKVFFDSAFSERSTWVVSEFSHAIITNIAVHVAVFSDSFSLAPGKFAAADRTGDKGTEYIGISAWTPGFCLSRLEEGMVLIHSHVWFTVRLSILINASIFRVVEYFINLIVAGTILTIFVGDIPGRMADRKTGKIILDSILHDRSGSGILFNVPVFYDISVGGALSGNAHSFCAFIVKYSFDTFGGPIALCLVYR